MSKIDTLVMDLSLSHHSSGEEAKQMAENQQSKHMAVFYVDKTYYLFFWTFWILKALIL